MNMKHNKTETSSYNIEETNVNEKINIQITENSTANKTINNTEKQNQSTSYISDIDNSSSDESDYETAPNPKDSKIKEIEELSKKFATLTCYLDLKIEGENENENLVDDILVPVGSITSKGVQDNVELIENRDYHSDENDSDDDNDDDDDGSWITPGKFDFII